MTFDSWESYFYPDTYDGTTGGGTLVNRFKERDPDKLSRLEYIETHAQAVDLELGRANISHTYDAEHLKQIHGHLFANVYEWAGEYRSVSMSKNLSSFAAPSDIDRYLADARDRILETNWAQLDRTGFAMKAAEVFAYVNQAHPFREGNGRATKLFMQDVAELSRFDLDYSPVESGVGKDAWNQRSMLSGPDLGAYTPQPDAMVPIFDRLAQPRVGEPKPVRPPQPRGLSASFPAPASAAATKPQSRPGTTRDLSSSPSTDRGRER